MTYHLHRYQKHALYQTLFCRKSVAQFFSQVEVEMRDNMLCIWPSCYPVDVA